MTWLVVVVALSTFTVETAFIYVATAKRLLESGIDLPLDIKAIAYFWLVVGLPADVVFNVTRGTWIFKELPRELLFSSRVQRHVDESSGWRLERAVQWGVLLNAIDPKHIRF